MPKKKMRVYKDRLGREFFSSKDTCLFCRHCTDIFVDASGPYRTVCAFEHETNGDWQTCGRFKDDEAHEIREVEVSVLRKVGS